MIRIIFALLLCCSLEAHTWADPIRKVSADETDKLVKECVQSFLKSLLAGDKDAAGQSCEAPFRDHNGIKIETLESITKQFDRPPPRGISAKIVEFVTLDKLNLTLKKTGKRELQEAILKDYGKYLGTEGRVVLVAGTRDGDPIPGHPLPIGPIEEIHMLVKVEDGKAKIVGISRSER